MSKILERIISLLLFIIPIIGLFMYYFEYIDNIEGTIIPESITFGILCIYNIMVLSLFITTIFI